VSPEPSDQNTHNEIVALQAILYEKAATYTKVILSLGYGGFFIAWSGTKQYLSPRIIIASALCETVSLFIFIIFEIWQVSIANTLSIKFSREVTSPGADVPAALKTHRAEVQRLYGTMFAAQPIIFWACAFTGLTGGLLLIYAFVAGLCRMWA
jgi:hypothetical protein